LSVAAIVPAGTATPHEVLRLAAAVEARSEHPIARAIRDRAAALILVHNHPSGDPTPSSEDVALTERLRQVGEVVGIRVLDHVVVGHGRYVSLAEERRW
jgi:DNA repair protein RadC